MRGESWDHSMTRRRDDMTAYRVFRLDGPTQLHREQCRHGSDGATGTLGTALRSVIRIGQAELRDGSRLSISEVKSRQANRHVHGCQRGNLGLGARPPMEQARTTRSSALCRSRHQVPTNQ